MKWIVGITITLAVLVVASQVWAKSVSANIETHPYKIIQAYEGFEIRKYAPANFSYVTMNSDDYDEVSSKGFRELAGYIFGGNEEQAEIAMTSPVTMEMDETITMKFMIPSKYRLSELPEPNSKLVHFKHEPEKTVAAIEFGGYADDTKIQLFEEILTKLLKKEGIQHQGDFSFLGYNSPFEFFNRRNEVIVEVDWPL